MDSLSATEALGAKGATHPRISLAQIEAAIEQENYINAGDAAERVGQTGSAAMHIMTLCFLTLRNGYVVIGKSAPASPENFDREKGKTFAREDAIRQIWPLMAFSLRDKLAAA